MMNLVGLPFFVDFSLVMIYDLLDQEIFMRTDHVLRVFCRLFLLHIGIWNGESIRIERLYKL